jgi:hypothetical protein
MTEPRSAYHPLRYALRRLPNARTLYQLGDLGTIERTKGGWRAAHLHAGQRRWTFAVSGAWKTRALANDPTGKVVGQYLPRAFRGGGSLPWYGQELVLRPISNWRQRYALDDHGHDILTADAKPGGRRPVTMTVLDPGLADPGLLLLTAVIAVWSASEAATMAGIVAGVSVAGMG